MLEFFSKKGYYQGVAFLLLMMVVSCANDVIAKYIGQRLDSIEVIFFRFFFSLLTILPFAIARGTKAFKTEQMATNIMRGVLGVISFYLYTASLVHLQIVEVVTILWTIPLFVLLLSTAFLGETVSLIRWLVTAAGFLGLAFITMYDSNMSFSFKLIYILPAAAAFLFAVQDVMIKKLVDNDSKITMLLYFSLVTTVLSLVPAMYVWQTPTAFELSMLFLYGSFANLMQYFIFRAFAATDLSALAPYRYLEFLFSAVAGFVFFAEIPGTNVILGAIILVPTTFYLGYSENKKQLQTAVAEKQKEEITLQNNAQKSFNKSQEPQSLSQKSAPQKPTHSQKSKQNTPNKPLNKKSSNKQPSKKPQKQKSRKPR